MHWSSFAPSVLGSHKNNFSVILEFYGCNNPVLLLAATCAADTLHLQLSPPVPLLHSLPPPLRPFRSITAGSAETACATRAPRRTCLCQNAAGTARLECATSAWKRLSRTRSLPRPSTQQSSCICSTTRRVAEWGSRQSTYL